MKKWVKRIKSEQGHTLIEALLVVLLFGVLSIAAWTVFIGVNENYYRVNTKSEVMENGRVVLDFIRTEVRKCRAYYVPTNTDEGDTEQNTEFLVLDITGSQKTEDDKKHVIRFGLNKSEKKVRYNGITLAEHIENVEIEVVQPAENKPPTLLRVEVTVEKEAPMSEINQTYIIQEDISVQYKERENNPIEE